MSVACSFTDIRICLANAGFTTSSFEIAKLGMKKFGHSSIY